MLKRSLELQPRQQRARWFLGVWQRQEGRPAEAAETWQPLLSQVDAATAATLRVQIDAARQETGLAPLRAEEHTSELQSLMRNSYAVSCLKKKNITAQNRNYKYDHTLITK